MRYVNSEEFTNDFINSIRDDKAANFQSRYRAVDVLLIDDIQFLQGKAADPGGVLPTFNTLHNANKRVVITSDVPPKLLSGFEERMRSRFSGVCSPTSRLPTWRPGSPSCARRRSGRGPLPPDDVAELIASRISTNIRELEGALIRVTAFASLSRQQVDLGWPRWSSRTSSPTRGGNQITAAAIMGPPPTTTA